MTCLGHAARDETRRFVHGLVGPYLCGKFQQFSRAVGIVFGACKRRISIELGEQPVFRKCCAETEILSGGADDHGQRRARPWWH